MGKSAISEIQSFSNQETIRTLAETSKVLVLTACGAMPQRQASAFRGRVETPNGWQEVYMLGVCLTNAPQPVKDAIANLEAAIEEWK